MTSKNKCKQTFVFPLKIWKGCNPCCSCWSPSLAASILLCRSCWICWSLSSSESTWPQNFRSCNFSKAWWTWWSHDMLSQKPWAVFDCKGKWPHSWSYSIWNLDASTLSSTCKVIMQLQKIYLISTSSQHHPFTPTCSCMALISSASCGCSNPPLEEGNIFSFYQFLTRHGRSWGAMKKIHGKPGSR